MFVYKLDAGGNPVLGDDGKPLVIEVPDNHVSTEEHEKQVKAASNKAAYDAKKKFEKDLEEANAARESLQARMDAKDKADKERERQALPPDQQVVARMTEMEHGLAQARAETARVREEATHQVRQVGLVAYRERALRDVPEHVHAFVGGNSEEEIDASVDQAVQTYTSVEQKIRQDLEQRFAQGQQSPQTFQQPGYTPMAPPPNPAYVQPVPQYYAQQAGFPTATNPPQMPDPSQGQPDVTEMTSEQAVRSGRYGGEVRERIHAAMKAQNRYPGSLGSAPRHWSAGQAPQGHVAMPGGVMQPQGTPMGPVQPVGFQQPQPQPSHPYGGTQGQSPQTAARAQATEAISRMHAGGNQIANGDSASATALQAAHQHAQARGIASPAQAFGSRFAPTPPITNGQA
jgi:hypothetical protein